jgi:histidinol-phosphatase
VSTTATLDGAYLSTCGFDYWPEDLLVAVKRADLVMRTWGDGYGYALAATGRIDAMLDPTVSLWDIAPMPVIMAEAGGRFSAIDGQPGAHHRSGLATNGVIHDALLHVIASVTA